MASGKDSPFNPDGKSGAPGNSDGGAQSGMSGHRGPDRKQQMGNNGFNPDSVPDGGRVPAFDPPGDRDGLVGQTAKGGMLKSGPMRMGAGRGGKKSSLADGAEGQHGTETENDQKVGPVGNVPNSDTAD
jgi:hypothetical protein